MGLAPIRAAFGGAHRRTVAVGSGRLFAVGVWFAQEAGGGGEGGRHTRGPLDHGGQVVVDEGAVTLERWGAQRSEDGGRDLGRNDGFGLVERRRRAPEVCGPGPVRSPSPPPAPLPLPLLLVLALLLAHTVSSVSSESGRRQRAVRSW